MNTCLILSALLHSLILSHIPSPFLRLSISPILHFNSLSLFEIMRWEKEGEIENIGPPCQGRPVCWVMFWHRARKVTERPRAPRFRETFVRCRACLFSSSWKMFESVWEGGVKLQFPFQCRSDAAFFYLFFLPAPFSSQDTQLVWSVYITLRCTLLFVCL